MTGQKPFSKIAFVIALSVSLTLVFGSAARAQNAVEIDRDVHEAGDNGGLLAFLDRADESSGQSAPEPYEPGHVSAEPFGFALAGLEDDPSVDLYGGGVGVNYFIMEDVALRGELYGLYADQTGTDATGAGFNLLGRWHFLRRDAWSLFAEGGAGVLQTDVSLADTPNDTDGTHFNFSTHAGVGATYRLAEGTSLVGAFRFTHISNAGISGSEENPGHNAVGGYLGVRFEF